MHLDLKWAFASLISSQAIVTRRINSITATWRDLNPTFDDSGGSIVFVGHSLGSLICFDILSKQLPPSAETAETASGEAPVVRTERLAGLLCSLRAPARHADLALSMFCRHAHVR